MASVFVFVGFIVCNCWLQCLYVLASVFVCVGFSVCIC